MSLTTEKVPIPNYVLVQFLEGIETLNRRRQDIRASDILGSTSSSNRDLYGGPAQRRNLQKKWDELKHFTPSNYKALLDSYAVKASTCTLLEVEKLKGRRESDEDEDEDEDELLSESFQHSCAVSNPSPSPAVFTAARALSTPNKVQAALNYQTPDRLMSVTTPSSVPHEGASVAASSLSGLTTVQSWWLGSEGNPHQETVNLAQPEFNNVLEFHVLQNYMHTNHNWTCYEMRGEFQTLDIGEWSIQCLSDTQLLVCGPGQNSILRFDTYHSLNQLTDEATIRAHAANNAAIDRNPARKRRFWVFNFPEGTKLNPSVLLDGDSDKTLARHTHVVTVDKADSKTTNDIVRTVLYWRIVDGRSGIPMAVAQHTTPTLKDLGL
jgi:hypothetical protein